jgi:hypothetical protein
MPIILAIEPDRRQAAHLTALVHRRVKAELILVPTTAGALDAIGNRVPDLVLIPALLSPQDDAALAAALRVIAAAARVQMLTIPVLGPPRPAAKSGGVLSALRRDKSRSAEPDGCDPAVFAEQIASYLERAAEERAATAPDVPQPAAPAVAEVAETASEAEQPGDTVSEWRDEEPGDESVSFALEEVARALFSDAGSAPEAQVEDVAAVIDEEFAVVVEPVAPPAAAIELRAVAAAPPEVSEADAEWATVDQLISALQLMPLAAIEATEEDEWIAPVRDPQTATEKSEGVVDTPAAGARSEQEWVALVESLRHDVERIRTERADKPAPRTAPDPSSRPRKPKPAQDEWGLFDPEQCGFAALLAKLEEVTEEERSAVVNHQPRGSQ